MQDRAEVLRVVARTLDRESHVVASRPNLFWQQMHNRLQWEAADIRRLLELDLARRTVAGSESWFLDRTPPRESRTLVRTLSGHVGPVNECAFSPDGELIVSAGDDGTVRLWEAATGQEIANLVGGTGVVTDCSFSPDGRALVSAGRDGNPRVWDVATGSELFVLTGSMPRFCGNGRLLVSAVAHGGLMLWNVPDGSLLQALEGNVVEPTSREEWLDNLIDPPDRDPRQYAGHSGAVTSFRISPDGRTVISASRDSTLIVWDAETGREISKLIGHSDSVNDCDLGPDGTTIVSAGSDATIRIWDARTGVQRLALEGHTGPALRCLMSPDGSTILSLAKRATTTYSRYTELRVWDASTGECLHHESEQDGHSFAAPSFSPDGLTIAWTRGRVMDDQTIVLLDPASGESHSLLTGHGGMVMATAFRSDGRMLLTASRDGTLRTWHLSKLDRGERPPARIPYSRGCLISPDRGTIASAGSDRSLRVFDTTTGVEHGAPMAHGSPIKHLAYGQHGSLLITIDNDHLKVWDAATAELRRELRGHESHINAFSLAPDERSVATASADRTVRVWDLSSGAALATLSGHDLDVNDCVFSPDGGSVVSAGADATLRIWDLPGGAERTVLRWHTEPIRFCAFSPDGRRIASASEGNELAIWDAVDREIQAVLSGHSDRIRVIGFSPDGSTFLSAADDGTIKIWDAINHTSTAAPKGFLLKRMSEISGDRRPARGVIQSEFVGHGAKVWRAVFSPDGRFVFSTGEDRRLSVWRAQTAEEVATLPLADTGVALAIHDGASLVVCGDASGNLHRLELQGIEYRQPQSGRRMPEGAPRDR